MNMVYSLKDRVKNNQLDLQIQVAFTELKNEVYLGHQDIVNGNVHAISDVRSEYGLCKS